MTSIIYFLLFLSLFLMVLFACHYFVYFSIIRFFEVSGMLKKVLLISIIFLSLSFILSSILARWKDCFLIRAFYFFSGFWLGLLLYLILASVAVWIIFFAGKKFGFNLNISLFANIFFIFAFLISIYGVYNAFDLKVKNIDVSIPNLPSEWENKKIVHISDLHLGLIHRDLFMKNLVEKINLINPEIVAITGDFFDSVDGDFDFLPKWISKIHSNQGIYFVTGNHETYLGLEKTFDVLEKTKMKILKDEVVDLDGLKLIGIDYPNRNENKDIIETLNSLQEDFLNQPNILLCHSPAFVDKIKDLGINFQLSGHTHSGQIFPINFITQFIYKGYSYGLHKIGDYSIYTTSGAGTWGPPMRVGTHSEIVVITFK
ncbi:metallophosphoesterase [Patescibacteria group bacterium]